MNYPLMKYNNLVYYGPNRQEGFYHQILLHEFITITSTLSQAFGQWGQDCTCKGCTCGVCFYISSGDHGSMKFTHQADWGPF